MSILDWLQHTLAGRNAVLTFSDSEIEFSGLNMKQVIDAHMAWRTRLTDILDGKSMEQPEVGEVGRDDACLLGKWINGTARSSFGHLSEFGDLRKAHSEFHLCAAEVLMKHRDNKRDQARDIVKGPLRTFSDRVQLDIIRLYAAARK